MTNKIEPKTEKTLVEDVYIDMGRLDKLIKNPYLETDKVKMLKQYRARLKKQRGRIEYHYSENSIDESGRLYVRNSLGLQMMDKDIRAYLCEGKLRDFDLVSSGQMVFKNLFEKNDISCPELNYLIKNKSTFMKQNKITKKDLLKVMFSEHYNGKNETLKAIHMALYNKLLPTLEMSIRWRDLFDNCKETKPKNWKGSLLSIIYQSIECDILKSINRYFNSKGFKIVAFIFDGALLDAFECEETVFRLMAGCAEHVLEETGFAIKIAEKPLRPSQEWLKKYKIDMEGGDSDDDDDVKDMVWSLKGYENFNWERVTIPTLKNLAEWFVELRHTSLIKLPNGALFILGRDNIWRLGDCVSSSNLNLQIADCLKADYFKIVKAAKDQKNTQMMKQLNIYYHTFVKKIEGPDADGIAKNIAKMCNSCEANSDLFLSRPELLAFSDGVYDLNKHEFRPIEPEDYIFKTTGYPFPTKPSDPKVNSTINDFFNSVFATSLVKEYVLCLFARALYGEVVEEIFTILKGNGRNGKGLTITLIDKAFGGYFYALDPKALTHTTQSADGTNSQFVNLYGCRFISSSEPPKGQKLLSAVLKMLSGNDKISVRTLHGKPVSFRVTGVVNLSTNDMPLFDVMDDALMARNRNIEYPFTFRSDVDADEDMGDLNNIRQSQEGIKELFRTDEFRDEFMLMLLKIYRDKFGQSKMLETPADVMKYTNKNSICSLPYEKWFNSVYEYTAVQRHKVKSSDVYKDYSEEMKCRSDALSMRGFHQSLQQIVKRRKIEGVFYYVGVQKKDLEVEVEE
jgi:hypothetical protein